LPLPSGPSKTMNFPRILSMSVTGRVNLSVRGPSLGCGPSGAAPDPAPPDRAPYGRIG
jgi:hypothetical protein